MSGFRTTGRRHQSQGCQRHAFRTLGRSVPLRKARLCVGSTGQKILKGNLPRLRHAAALGRERFAYAHRKRWYELALFSWPGKAIVNCYDTRNPAGLAPRASNAVVAQALHIYPAAGVLACLLRRGNGSSRVFGRTGRREVIQQSVDCIHRRYYPDDDQAAQ